MQAPENEPVSGLFDQCSKIQEKLNEAHVIATRLIGGIPDDNTASTDGDVYLENLARRLRDISRDAGNLVKQLQEIERRF